MKTKRVLRSGIDYNIGDECNEKQCGIDWNKWTEKKSDTIKSKKKLNNMKWDPFSVFFVISCLIVIAFVALFELQENDNRSKLIREAIQKNWTPEQIKAILETK